MNNIFNLLDIEGGVRSFFASLAASLSFDLIFIIGVSLEAIIILLFALRARFSYEIRATKALDKLNKWLFVNKKLGTENIKEFTNLVKKTPKRLAYNWQQYILYREKVPSEYLDVENVIEKPLRASSFKTHVRSMGIVSLLLAGLMFIIGVAHNNSGDTVLNASMLIVALIIPICILIMCGVATIIFNARKNYNLDELYQNHHLFQRFIDNACVDLPAFIDYTLLFTVEEIEKGIPALREYLENRTRKEKEEFDRAKNEMVVYEKYDFEKAGVDGSNILERAMNESETYLNNKNKTLAKISQFEASLESLKKNFDNIQKDYQRKMQVSKENIDRLRQQQEETTSRIESNFLRKQQATEIAKQEKEEADFEQQKRRYLVEKNDYEEEIKNLNKELDEGKSIVERAMLSEYQSFYKRLCQRAFETIDEDIKNQLVEVKDEKEKTEDELAEVQTIVKRLEDENSTLRKQLNIVQEESSERLRPVKEEKVAQEEKTSKEKEVETEVFDDVVKENEPKLVKQEEAKVQDPVKEESTKAEKKVEQFVFDDEPAEYDLNINKTPVVSDVTSVIETEEAPVTEESKEEPKVEAFVFEDEEPSEYDYDEVASVEEVNDKPEEYDEVVEEVPEELEEYEEELAEDEEYKEEDEVAPVARRRGRPLGSTNKTVKMPSRGRGRPRKEKKDKDNAPKKRGRPAGSKNKVNSPSVKKRALNGRGRPRKNPSNNINEEIDQEERRINVARANANNQINETLKNMEPNAADKERIRLINEIERLKQEAANITEDTPADEIEVLNQRMEELLDQIDKLG